MVDWYNRKSKVQSYLVQSFWNNGSLEGSDATSKHRNPAFTAPTKNGVHKFNRTCLAEKQQAQTRIGLLCFD